MFSLEPGARTPGWCRVMSRQQTGRKLRPHVALELIPDRLLLSQEQRLLELLICLLPGLFSIPPWVPEDWVLSRADQGLLGISLAHAFSLCLLAFSMKSSGLGWPTALGGHPGWPLPPQPFLTLLQEAVPVLPAFPQTPWNNDL